MTSIDPRLDTVLAGLPRGASALLRDAYAARAKQQAREEAEQVERSLTHWRGLVAAACAAHPPELPPLDVEHVPPVEWVGTETAWGVHLQLERLAPIRRLFTWHEDEQRWVASDNWDVLVCGGWRRSGTLAAALLLAFDTAREDDAEF